VHKQQTFLIVPSSKRLKGTHKPLIHPPLGFCRKAEAFFFFAWKAREAISDFSVRDRTAHCPDLPDSDNAVAAFA
jgi:hypothetical protein